MTPAGGLGLEGGRDTKYTNLHCGPQADSMAALNI